MNAALHAIIGNFLGGLSARRFSTLFVAVLLIQGQVLCFWDLDHIVIVVEMLEEILEILSIVAKIQDVPFYDDVFIFFLWIHLNCSHIR